MPTRGKVWNASLLCVGLKLIDTPENDGVCPSPPSCPDSFQQVASPPLPASWRTPSALWAALPPHTSDLATQGYKGWAGSVCKDILLLYLIRLYSAHPHNWDTSHVYITAAALKNLNLQCKSGCQQNCNLYEVTEKMMWQKPNVPVDYEFIISHNFIWFLTSVLQQAGCHHFPVPELRSCHTPQAVHQIRRMLMELRSKTEEKKKVL